MHRMYAEEQPHDDDPEDYYQYDDDCLECGNEIHQTEQYRSNSGTFCSEYCRSKYHRGHNECWDGYDQARLDDLPHIMPATIEDDELPF